jgi:2,4-dienoyl-CoA reductase (NADPH2)
MSSQTTSDYAESSFDQLVKPLRLGPKLLRNSIFQAPMSVSYAELDGTVSRKLAEHYGRRAQGGVGMVITENFAISVAGRQLPRQGLVSDASFLPGLTMLATEIKRHGAVAVLQIVHAGRYAGPWDNYGARRRLAPSAIPFPLPMGQVCPAEITHEEIEQTVAEFGAATELAREAGFDGVEIHGGQGFLVSSFLTPRMNKREDEYGGSFENRCRFPLAVVDAVAAAAGPEVLVGFHLMSDELMPGGWEVDDAVRLGIELESHGVHFVMPIASTFESMGAAPQAGLFDRRMFQHDEARRLATKLNLPVLTNGGFGDPEDANRVMAEGEVAAVGLARPLFADPDWLAKVVSRRQSEIRRCSCAPATCLRTQLTGSICNAWTDTEKERGFLGYDYC